jgi:hypothetical protein
MEEQIILSRMEEQTIPDSIIRWPKKSYTEKERLEVRRMLERQQEKRVIRCIAGKKLRKL